MIDAPMPLPAAVQVCFPHGGVTVNTLRRAIRAGELAAELIGKQYMVTPGAIEDWREQTCRVRARGRASTSRTETPANSLFYRAACSRLFAFRVLTVHPFLGPPQKLQETP